jgi:hypothetical protein
MEFLILQPHEFHRNDPNVRMFSDFFLKSRKSSRFLEKILAEKR